MLLQRITEPQKRNTAGVKMTTSSKSSSSSLWLLALLVMCSMNVVAVSESEEEFKTYIIHVDDSHKPSLFLSHESWYMPTLTSVSSDMLLYTYTHAIRGFSARLTPTQLSQVE
ncbi:hypothetical protein ACFE04_005010 [Oxalis oulophora]